MEQNAPSKIHTVTRSYLAGWVLPPETALRPVSVKYGDQKPRTPAAVGWVDQWWGADNPTLNETCERICRKLENVVPGLLRNVEQHWPFAVDRERGLLAQFMALHGLRNDAMKRWLTARREDYLRSVAKTWNERDRAAFEKFAADQLSAPERAHRLLTMTNKLASSLASMHWTLLRFSEPIVITSDHPLCGFPLLEDTGEIAVSAVPVNGWGNIIEFRFPLTPRLVLLGTWHVPDANDESDYLIDCHWNDAAAINAVVRAQASRQWFRVHPGPMPAFPGLIVRDANRTVPPIAPRLIPGYTMVSARESKRRLEVVAKVERLIDSEDDNHMFIARPGWSSGEMAA